MRAGQEWPFHRHGDDLRKNVDYVFNGVGDRPKQSNQRLSDDGLFMVMPATFNAQNFPVFPSVRALESEFKFYLKRYAFDVCNMF